MLHRTNAATLFLCFLTLSISLDGCTRYQDGLQFRMVLEEELAETIFIEVYQGTVGPQQAARFQCCGLPSRCEGAVFVFSVQASYGADSVRITAGPKWEIVRENIKTMQKAVILTPSDTVRFRCLEEGHRHRAFLCLAPGRYPVARSGQGICVPLRHATDNRDVLKRVYLARRYSPTGKLETERTFAYDSLRERWFYAGTHRRYDDSGRLWIEWNPLPDNRYGESITYFWKNGQKRQSGERGKQLAQTYSAWWDTTGTCVARARYDSLGPHGTVAKFWNNGQIMFLTDYSRGQRHGSHRYWHEDGSFGGASIFQHGTGIMRQHYPDGTPMIEHPYVQGKRHGTSKDWYPNGQLSKLVDVEHDQYAGQFILWYADGRVHRRFDYNDRTSGN